DFVETPAPPTQKLTAHLTNLNDEIINGKSEGRPDMLVAGNAKPGKSSHDDSTLAESPIPTAHVLGISLRRTRR
ncbi:MAG: hypothetical protein ACPGVG_12825, partial [Mycobacterium sp.]